MENFVKYFRGVAHVKCLSRAAFILAVQRPLANVQNLSKNFGINYKTIELYRRIAKGTHTQETPKHIQEVQSELYHEAKSSNNLTAKEIKFLINEIGRPLEKTKEKQPTEQPLDFELDYEVEETPVKPAPVEQPKDYLPEITERELRSNRLMYFAGVMTGIALLLLFVMIERA